MIGVNGIIGTMVEFAVVAAAKAVVKEEEEVAKVKVKEIFMVEQKAGRMEKAKVVRMGKAKAKEIKAKEKVVENLKEEKEPENTRRSLKTSYANITRITKRTGPVLEQLGANIHTRNQGLLTSKENFNLIQRMP